MIIKQNEQGSDEWLEDKIGVLSGTRIKKIITSKKLALSATHGDMIYTLIDENITGMSADKIISNSAMERGNLLEPRARSAYERKTSTKIIETGLCLSDNNDKHGVSPDGWTEDYTGAVEIKCPGIIHLKYLSDNVLPDEYKLQCINYFLVNEKLEWLDFVSFRPEFYPYPLFIKRVTRVELEKEIKLVSEAIGSFFIKYDEVFEFITF
jgi:hypothetical protein